MTPAQYHRGVPGVWRADRVASARLLHEEGPRPSCYTRVGKSLNRLGTSLSTRVAVSGATCIELLHGNAMEYEMNARLTQVALSTDI